MLCLYTTVLLSIQFIAFKPINCSQEEKSGELGQNLGDFSP